MKLLPLLSSLALVGTLAFAAAIPRDLDDATSLQLDKRAPEAVSEPVAVVEERGEKDKVDVSVKVRVKQGRPNRDFEPDGSGYGYRVDWRGNGPPSSVPSSWNWFGRDIGWAPYRGWRPPPRWEPPFVFIRIWIKVTWWSPPDYWRRYYYNRWDDDWYRYGIPVHWNWRPFHGGRGHYERRPSGWYWSSRRGGGGGGGGGGVGRDDKRDVVEE